MNMTKQARRVVLASACFIRGHDRRRLISAMITAPAAPMPPPSVGVAMPTKIVPSTRKISASGGASTNTTRSAMRESRPSFSERFSNAMAKVQAMPNDAE
jgi:hypothetical protein